jgi:hypothetical protein
MNDRGEATHGDKRLRMVSQVEECRCVCPDDSDECPWEECRTMWVPLAEPETTYMVLPDSVVKST